MNPKLKGIPIYSEPEPHYLWEDIRLCLGPNMFEMLQSRLKNNGTYSANGISTQDAERILNEIRTIF